MDDMPLSYNRSPKMSTGMTNVLHDKRMLNKPQNAAKHEAEALVPCGLFTIHVV